MKFHHLWLKFGSMLLLIMRMINEKKKKWTTLSRKACYRPNVKPWKDPSEAINKQEIRHTHPEYLELSCLKKWSLQPSCKWSYLWKTSVINKKLYVFETKRLINRKLECITKIEVLLLKSCGNFLVYKLKNWRSSYS